MDCIASMMSRMGVRSFHGPTARARTSEIGNLLTMATFAARRFLGTRTLPCIPHAGKSFVRERLQRMLVLDLLQEKDVSPAGNRLADDLCNGVDPHLEELRVPGSAARVELPVLTAVAHVVEEVFHVVAHEGEP